jgi:hypothetical protein
MSADLWQITRACVGVKKGSDRDESALEALLADGWEPFAVTLAALGEGMRELAGYVYHLRRKAEA